MPLDNTQTWAATMRKYNSGKLSVVTCADVWTTSLLHCSNYFTDNPGLFKWKFSNHRCW